MNLYKISQDINNEYDTYDSAIVAAENEDIARMIYPGGRYKDSKTKIGWHPYAEVEWVKFSEIDKIKVEFVGEAKINQKRGVILASFNAG